MKTTLSLASISFFASVALCAESYSIETIEVEESLNSSIVKNVAGEEVRSADLADALYKLEPEMQLIRRSGIANDIILRGLRKDNINVLIDGGKIYGGCPNRMDPPISHILSNNVDRIVVKEGPYDVENFGTLGGVIEINTLQPKSGLNGEGYLNIGSWGYRKIGARASGGNDSLKILISASNESSSQYQDGDGKTLAEQVDAYADKNPSTDGQRYMPMYRDMKAYRKKTAMAKVFIDIADNQELKISYTVNRSDDILYPNSKMDAKKDDSDLFNIKYSAYSIGEYSKKLDIEFYNSWVYHPMGNYYRSSSMMMGVFENIMNSRIYGGKVRNSVDFFGSEISYGYDGSKRKWSGYYALNSSATGVFSINNAVTENSALFATLKKHGSLVDIESGLRYDTVSINNADLTVEGQDYYYLSGFINGTYNIGKRLKLFAGIGKSSRVPDAKELYFQDKSGVYIGNPKLKKVTNYEADVAIEKELDKAVIKLKVFYGKLKDFIIFNKQANRYENIDAKLYGASLYGVYSLSDDLYIDSSIAYQRGKKDELLDGQSDIDLPNILPLKANFAINYEHSDDLDIKLFSVMARGWSNFDSDNGEQKISGYTIFNLKANKEFKNGLGLTLGVDNILDRRFAITNTYADMTLTTGSTDAMLLNEPGRYYYCNISYKF